MSSRLAPGGWRGHAHGVLRALGNVVVVAWIVFASVVLILRYVVLPNVDAYRPDLERLASRLLGETVTVAAIEASWRGLRPSLALRDVRIIDAQGGAALELPSVRATLSWDSLLVFELRLASLEVDGPQLAVRRDGEGQLFIAGYAIHRKATPDNRLGEWLLAQNEIRIRKARIVWHDEWVDAAPDAAGARVAREDLVLSDVNFALVRSGWRHRIALHATPPASLGAPLDLRAVIEHPVFARRFADPSDWHGELFANVASGDVFAWRTWVPLPTMVEAGRGRTRVWLRFSDASEPAGAFVRRLGEQTKRPVPAALDRIADVTADLALDDVAVRWGASQANEYAALASVDGRVVASQTSTQQRFAATHMALQPRNGITVPATDFKVERTIGPSPDDETGDASLGAIDIGVSLGLVPEPFIPPAIVEKFTVLKPHGKLDALRYRWTGPVAAPKTFQVDARFDRVGLAAQAPTAEAIRVASQMIVGPDGVVRKPHPAFGQPGFENLGGSLSAIRIATPPGAVPVTNVKLDLQGTDASITTPGLFDDPLLRLAHLRAQVGVKVEGSDLEVTVHDGALDNAELAGTVELTFRHGPGSGSTVEGGAPGRGWIDLDAHLTRADVVRVPRYLPNIIGEKPRAYLAKALLGGKVTDARFRMHGPLEKLSLRALPGATARPYPVALPNALIAVRDGAGGHATSVGDAKAAPADEPVFHAVIKVRGATLLYGPARAPDPSLPAAPPSIPWPVFEDLDADIVFDQAQMTVFGHSTRVFGYRLTDVRAVLPALADPAHVLRVTGRGDGPLQDLLRFVNESPVGVWTRHFTEPSRGSGNAQLALALDLPLTHPRDAEVAGSIRFANDDLTLNANIPALRQIDGRLDFTDRGMTIDGMTARSLGGPLQIDASTGKDGYIDLKAAGTIDVAALKADQGAAGAPPQAQSAIERAAPWLSGSAHYDVALRLLSKRAADLADGGANDGPKNDDAPDLVISSDLVGLGIALPAPLDKPAAEQWPLRIAIKKTPVGTGAADSEHFDVSLASLVHADITRERTPQGLAVTRAAYAVGDAGTSHEGATSIRVDLPKIDLDAWRDVIRKVVPARGTAEPTAGGNDALLPAEATVKTPLLHAGGRDFTNVTIDAHRLVSGWQADVAADQVAGRLSYTDVTGAVATRNGVAPASTGRLVARLSRLAIPQAQSQPRADDVQAASRLNDFPAIDVVVDRFELRGRSLGKLEVVAENVGQGDDREWKLEKLGLTTAEAHFTAQGAWGHSKRGENTRLDFDLTSSDVGALMDRFGLTRTIKNGTAHLSGDIAWAGGPTTIDFGSMGGRLALEADKGQFLKADPGIAKLLNILSLQGLARRLTLDFSDVFDAGFAFDTVRADVTVDRGIATTSDFTMKGVQATVSMVGSADLEHETTDLHVRVAPDIDAGAASLGVAVVNPVLGLATFAAQYFFKDEISRALSFEYNVAGPWKKPEVTKIDRNGRAMPVVPRQAEASRERSAPAEPQ